MAVCNATVPDPILTGDNLYGPRACFQPFINWAWNAYGFKRSEWDNGFGYEAACDTTLPLCRTLAAIWLLNYSASDYDNDQYSGDMLHWARRYVWEQIDDLRAGCGDGSASASASQTWFIFRWHAHIDLFKDFFFEFSVVERASTLIHEARHLGGKSHNANFPAGSVFGAGQAGADSGWDHKGAWMYEALYLWWFYHAATRTTPALRQKARSIANTIINNAFANHPGFTISNYLGLPG